MEKQTSGIRQSSMFLMELIIAVLFLSLCSAICIRLFINARVYEKDSYQLTQSVTSAQNIAEVFEANADYATGSMLSTDVSKRESMLKNISNEFTGSAYYLNDKYKSNESEQSDIIVYYDTDFHVCNADDALYRADVVFEYKDYMISADINMKKIDDSVADKPIYYLHVDHAVNQLGGAF